MTTTRLLLCGAAMAMVLSLFSHQTTAAETANNWACSIGDTSPGCASTDLAPMPVPSVGLVAAAGADGRIYAIGGYNNRSAINTVQAYNPTTNTWTIVAPRPTAMGSGAATTGLDGRIYVLGGCNFTSCPSDVVEVYTPSTNTWTTAAPMPTARYWLAAATGPDGTIYAIGGRSTSDFSSKLVEAYSPSTNTWRTVASMPVALNELAAAVGPDSRIYAMGGCANSCFSATTEAYAPSTNTWTTVAPMPTARATPAAVTGRDGRIYVIGGYNGTSPDGNTAYSVRTAEAYTTSTNSWAEVAPMPTARWYLAGAAGSDGRIYILGGSVSDNHTGLSTVEAYTPPAAPTATGTPTTTPTRTATATSTSTPFPTATPSTPPSITVYPGTETAGTNSSVEVTGAGFGSGETVTVSYSAYTTTGSFVTEQASTSAEIDGTFVLLNLHVPATIPPGTYEVTAVGQSTSRSASASFSVLAPTTMQVQVPTATATSAPTPTPTATSTATPTATVTPVPTPTTTPLPSVTTASPSVSILKVVILHRIKGHWVNTRSPKVGEKVDFVVAYQTRNAIAYKPSALLLLTRNGKPLGTYRMQSLHYLGHRAFHKVLMLSQNSMAGTLFAHFRLTVGSASAKRDRRFTLYRP